MDFFNNIGNFFGGLFGRKEEEEKRKPQAPTIRPSPLPVSRADAPTIRMPEPFQMPQQNNVAPPKLGGVVQRPKAPEKNIFENIGDFANDAVKNTTGMINDFATDPNNVPRNTLNFITGTKNPIDGATLDYSRKDERGRPLLVPKAPSKNIQDVANESLGGTLLNEVLVKPTAQAAPRLSTTFTGSKAEDLPQWIKDANEGIGGYNNAELESNFAPGADGNTNEFMGTLGTVGDILALTPIIGGTLRAGTTGVRRTIEGAADLVNGLRPAGRTASKLDDEASLAADLTRRGDDVATPAPREPGNPITRPAQVADNTPAITSANPDFVPPPTVRPQEPLIPATNPNAVLGGVEPPRIAPEVLAPRPISAADDQAAAIQKVIDEQAVQPTPAPAPVQSAILESPQATQARSLAAEAPPINPQAVRQAVEAERLADAPTDAIADGVPVLKSYGRDIPMTEKNGYVATKTPDGGTVYEKMSKVGSNRKGDTSFETRYYDDTGFKITKAQHAARVSGQLPTTPKTEVNTPQVSKPTPTTPKTEVPVTPTPAPELPPATNLGRIAQDAVQSGKKLDDAGWESLAGTVGRAADARAKELGTSVESIMEKVQLAAEPGSKIKTAKQAGLTADEFDLYTNMKNELTYLRNRADPSLITGGTIDPFYAPRQLTDTEFDPRLVNEEVRGASVGRSLRATDSDLDLTTVPFEQYIRRYGDANSVIKQSAFNTVEQMPVKLKGGGEELVDSGVKVSDGAKARFEVHSKKYIEKKDAIEQELSKGDFSVKQIDDLTQQMDDDINLAFKELMDDMPKDTAAGREAIARLTSQRGAYLQSTIRSNMFSNIVNRVFDQTGKALVQSTNQAMGIADSFVAAGLRTSKALSKGADARSVAREFSRGALGKKLKQDFRTNMAFAGKGKLSWLDAAYRAGSTALTSFGDLTTTTVKLANRAMLARAQAQGITSKAGMREYLRKNINGAEYRELLTGIQDTYAGYVSLPMSSGSRVGRSGNRLSKVDNFIANNQMLKNLGVSQRVRRELNDAIMPTLSGFAGATYRIGAKSLNASALGVPNMIRGLKLAKEGGESARQIGQIMMSRSLVDGVVGGFASAAVIGSLVAENAEWTGAYPTGDKNEAARWEKDGIVPNALSFDLGNGQKLQIQPGRVVGPFALPVVIPAVIASGGDIGEVFDGTLGQMLENLGVDSAIQNAGTIATALTGSGYQQEAAIKKLQRSAGFSTSSLVPVSGLQNNIANALDDTKRDTSGGFIDSIKARNPFTRPGLPAKTDNFGNPVRNNTQGSLGSQAVTTSNSGSNTGASVDPVNDEVNRLAKLGSEVTPGNDVKNPGGLDDAKVLLESKLYQGADDEKKAEYLKETLLGTQTKDINSSLSPEKRSALIEHKLQTEDQRKVWLEDNDNAANYYQGNYDNKKANKVLSQQDDNLQTKSGAKYLAIRAGVNQKYNADTALQNLYEDVTESEWRDMIDPDSDDYDMEMAERLYAYDAARTEAGVSGRGSDSSKAKYTEKKAKSGSGSGSKKFSFASLPSSLIGAGTTGKGTYADDAPLFKPIQDLRTPSIAAIPKGRNISVKKGIQV